MKIEGFFYKHFRELNTAKLKDISEELQLRFFKEYSDYITKYSNGVLKMFTGSIIFIWSIVFINLLDYNVSIGIPLPIKIFMMIAFYGSSLYWVIRGYVEVIILLRSRDDFLLFWREILK